MMEPHRIGSWIQTYTGKQFYPLDPQKEDVDIRDIAHALSLICRYAGNCKEFYSVAEHSILISHAVPPNDAIYGLLHDAAEAYLGDVLRPIKQDLPELRQVEDRIQRMIYFHFNLSPIVPHSVLRADSAILGDELKQVMSPPPAAWKLVYPPLDVRIACSPPEIAERRFLARFHEIIRSLDPQYSP
jgi:hypothetical protein